MRIELVALSPPALAALAACDRVAAERAIGLPLTDYALSAWRSTWQRRHKQVVADPLVLVGDWPCRDTDQRVVVRRAGSWPSTYAAW